MQEEENKMIDVGEADQVETEIDLDKPAEQTKPVEEKVEVEQVQEEEKPVAAETDTQKEESKEDELKKYSEGVQKRIAKLTRKMREAERQKEEAIQFADRTKKENEDLQTRFSKLDKSYVNEFESRVTTNLDAARSALKTAIEAQDVDAQVKAQEQIATLTADAARLASLKTLKDEQPEKQVNVTPQRAEKTAKIDPRADAWASNNPWFGNDTAMTYTAFDVHKTLVEKEGFDPQSEEYYAEIDKRMRLEFPQKFDKLEGNTTEKVKPAQTVASARRPAQTGRKL
jgi:DNA repair exonuclease SbcCD ATPase subunit